MMTYLTPISELDLLDFKEELAERHPNKKLLWEHYVGTNKFEIRYLTPDEPNRDTITRVVYDADDQTYYYLGEPSTVYDLHKKRPLH